MDAPKVFLSHASEDKQRFVLAFATALRARGIDVWLDQWEMAAGDSLVKKIFTEGIGESAAVVVVISTNSVTKRWVREELDAAVVKRINEESRLIPVVLDDLTPEQVPVPIRHLLWVVVPDFDKAEEAADEVAEAIFGARSKPPLGAPPGYADAGVERVSGLSQLDSVVLKSAGEESIRDFGDTFDTAEFLASLKPLGITEDRLLDSLQVLDTDGFVKLQRTMGSGLTSMRRFVLTWAGLEQYLSTYTADYGEMQHSICITIANGGDQGSDADLADATEIPRMIVHHVLELLELRGLLKLSQTNVMCHYFNVSPKLRRLLSE